jgi:hypothetical protein
MPDDSKRSSFNPSDWRAALTRWAQEHRLLPDAPSRPGIKSPESLEAPRVRAKDDRIPLGWWEAAFAISLPKVNNVGTLVENIKC